MSTEENRELSIQEADSVVDEKAVEEHRTHPVRVFAGFLAIPCLVISFIMAIFLFLLPPVGDFVFGVLAALGVILVIFRFMPWALRGLLGMAGLAAVVAGLAMYALSWSYGESFYQSGVEVLNTYTDPVERAIWPDHDRSRVAQSSFATETEAEMGRDILQFFGVITVLFGFFLLATNVLVGFVTGAARGRSGMNLPERVGANIAALGFILLFLGAVSEVIIAELLLLEQESWRVVANALMSGSFSFLFGLPAERFLMAMLAAAGSLGVVVLWLGVTMLILGGSRRRKIVLAAVAAGIALFVLSVVMLLAILMLTAVAVSLASGLFLEGRGRSATTGTGRSSGGGQEMVQTRYGPQPRRRGGII